MQFRRDDLSEKIYSKLELGAEMDLLLSIRLFRSKKSFLGFGISL